MHGSLAHALFVPPGVCCNFCVFFCPFWYPDAMVTSLVSPTRGFTFRFCVSGGERFFPRVDGMAVSSALGGSPQSVVPRTHRLKERFFFFSGRLFIPRERVIFFRLAGPRIGDGYTKLSLTPAGVPNES